MRIRLFASFLALTLAACGDDSDGGGGTTGPGTGGDDSGSSTDPSAGMTTTPDPDSSTSSPDPGTSSGGEESTTAVADDTTAGEESGSSTTGEPVAFGLFSDAFTEGGGIPSVHHVQGGNESPPLNWEGAPAGTMSFAVFFHDQTIDFEHSAIWNIPAEVTELPQDVDHVAMPPDVPGALQCRSWTGMFGYGGPGSAANFYQFTLYAIDVAEIPDTEIDEDSSLVEVRTALEAHSLGTATLTGQSTGP